MKWTRATELPDTDRDVLVANTWGDLFFASCETFPDGSRSWIPAEMETDRRHKFLWADVSMPTDEDWG